MALKQGTRLKMTHPCVVKWQRKGSDYCSLKWKSDPWKLETLKSHLQPHLDDSQRTQAYLSIPALSIPPHPLNTFQLASHVLSPNTQEASLISPFSLHPSTWSESPRFSASTTSPTSVPLSSSYLSPPHLDNYIPVTALLVFTLASMDPFSTQQEVTLAFRQRAEEGL